jgi:DNA mismatch repair protein MutS2
VDERTLRVLEFPKIRTHLAELAATAVGRESCERLTPALDADAARRALAETTEAAVLREHGDVPLRGTSDMREMLHRAQIGSALQPADLLALRDTLTVIRQCKGFILGHQEQVPLLADGARGIATFESLEAVIRRSIADDGSVPDSATPDLARIRREQQTANARIREKLEDLMRGPSGRMLQDPLITTRGDRHVVPVRQEFKGQFPGVLHDQSSSGATVFMEPLAIVPLGNQLRELAIAERQEILRLLYELTAQVASAGEPIGWAYEALGRVDFAVAKALLAGEMKATAPRLRTDGMLRLRRARHPLLTRDVVPIDVWLGEEFTTLVITGPNTGGKTVTLKTLGLLTLMAQAGLHIPADDGSEVSVFDQVFADMGDEQSIEQSLSTFSSHMGAIVGILAQLRVPAHGALVLLDEIGAGTDPTEGVALARSLIEHLHRLGARTAVTTHYNELKALAAAHSGIQNASVEFDAETLRPTYRLIIGVPGRSNALSIAERLGLDPQIVQRARGLLGPEVAAIDRVLSDIEADRRAYEHELAEAARHREQASELRTRAAQELERLRLERGKALSRLRDEADVLLTAARREVEAITTSLKAASGLQAVQSARRRLRDLAEQLAARALPEAHPEGEPLTEVKPGQSVYVLPLHRTGTVLAAHDPRGEVEVETGTLRVKVPLSALRAAGGDATERARDQLASTPARPPVPELPAVPVSIRLRGRTVDEAIPALDKYLDDAFMGGLRQITIVHGKGTGALRKAVHEFLKTHPHVRSFRLGEKSEGDTGATIVELHVP